MRILDVNNNLLETVDKSKGYLKRDSLFVYHHDAVLGSPEEGHYETVKEYPNGGKEVAWVIDAPKVVGREAQDEYEDILRFIPYTEQELANMRISELKENLQNTDYMVLKVVEGALTMAEIADTVKKRAMWRKEINELEVIAGIVKQTYTPRILLHVNI